MLKTIFNWGDKHKKKKDEGSTEIKNLIGLEEFLVVNKEALTSLHVMIMNLNPRTMKVQAKINSQLIVLIDIRSTYKFIQLRIILKKIWNWFCTTLAFRIRIADGMKIINEGGCLKSKFMI